MKHTIFILVMVLGCWACQDDDTGSFGVTMPKENIRFRATPGGAVMYYNLPADGDVFSLYVHYIDARGNKVLKVGGYGSDSLIVDGFNEARKDVTARVTLVNRNNVESEAVEVAFDTQDSAPYAFFERAEVFSYWGGFEVRYEAPEQVAGMAHVFYLGTNPLTQLEDTILVKSFPIMKGSNTLRFRLEQEREKNTVIVRTEDYRGYRVKQKVWENVDALLFRKLDLTTDNFIDVKGLSLEIDREKTGAKYLFDGDLKGIQRLRGGETFNVYTFLAGPKATGVPFIFDMKQQRVPVSVRIYGMLNFKLRFPSETYPPNDYVTSTIWQLQYKDKLPCQVKLYGGNDKDGDEWTELGSFSQSRLIDEEYRWSMRCSHSNYVLANESALVAADPVYIEVMFPAEMTKYRYLKLIVEEVFIYKYDPMLGGDYNPLKYVTMQEFEIYVKKD